MTVRSTAKITAARPSAPVLNKPIVVKDTPIALIFSLLALAFALFFIFVFLSKYLNNPITDPFDFLLLLGVCIAMLLYFTYGLLHWKNYRAIVTNTVIEHITIWGRVHRYRVRDIRRVKFAYGVVNYRNVYLKIFLPKRNLVYNDSMTNFPQLESFMLSLPVTVSRPRAWSRK